MSQKRVLRGGTIVTQDATRRVLVGDVVVDGARIVSVGGSADVDGATIHDCSGLLVMPGLIQAHVHLCQTLYRGRADDLPLLAWLRERIWPYEAALDEAALRACVRLAIGELLRSGTTAILDMGTVHHTDVIAEELVRTGLRAVFGKAMMDVGEGVPAGLRELTQASIDESDRLRRDWSGKGDGRLGYAYAPRFVLSCTEELLIAVGERVAQGARLHTHASEQQAEIEIVRRERGDDNIVYLDRLGLGGPRATLAHCVHPTAREREQLARAGTHVVHCPSSNLKLSSGFAPIPEMLAQGISVALGADGAPCNNNLDAFVELRLAGLIHKPRVGADGFSAQAVLDLATRGGAAALGLLDEIGSIEVGKRADLVVLDGQTLHATPAPDPVSLIVYAAQSRDVREVFVDGRHLVAQGSLCELTTLHPPELIAAARAQIARVQARLA